MKIVELIGEENENDSKYCRTLLVKLARTTYCNLIFSNQFIEKFKSIKQKNSIINFRVLELMVELACISPEILNQVEEKNFLADLISLLKSDDILIQLNALQLVSNFVTTQHGVDYLDSKGCLNWIQERIISYENSDPISDMNLPFMMKVFALIGQSSPSTIFNQYPRLLKKLLSLCESNLNHTLAIHSLAALSQIGASLEGKKLLNSLDTFDNIVIKTISKVIESDYNETRIEALVSLERLLSVDESDLNGEGEVITESWFQGLVFSKNSTTLILELCARPFSETRIAALNVVRVMATHIWGHKLLAAEPNFLKLLLDRSYAIDKGDKEAKYLIVRELAISPFTQLAFDKSQISAIQKYYKEGPFFVEIESTVSLESGS